MFDHFWDFDRWSKMERPGEAEIAGSHPLFVGFLGLGLM
jgi:hypothetical protein